MSDELDTTEKDQEQTTVELELGTPDLSAFVDDDEPELSMSDVTGGNKNAKPSIKPSFAIKKMMPPIFGMIANARGEHWNLEEAEVDDFAQAFDDCMAHYYPEMTELPPWAALALSGGMILAPRMMFDGLSDEQKAEIRKAMKEAKAQEEKEAKALGGKDA